MAHIRLLGRAALLLTFRPSPACFDKSQSSRYGTRGPSMKIPFHSVRACRSSCWRSAPRARNIRGVQLFSCGIRATASEAPRPATQFAGSEGTRFILGLDHHVI